MYAQILDKKLQREIKKIVKRNHILAMQIVSKMSEICQNPHHYKPLKAPMQNKRRAHVGHFVIIFEIDEENNSVVFLDFEHHDNAYK